MEAILEAISEILMASRLLPVLQDLAVVTLFNKCLSGDDCFSYGDIDCLLNIWPSCIQVVPHISH